MLKEMPFANALGVVSGAAWIVCSLFVALFPGFSMSLSQALVHGLDLLPLGTWQLTFTNFLSGLVISVISGWLFGWVLAWMYNRFSR